MRTVYEMERDLTKVCFRMEQRGVLIDPEYTSDALKFELGEIERAKQDFEADTGRAYKDSSKLFAEVFDERGERYSRTDKGNPSFKAEVLDWMDTPTARLINRIRYHEKRVGTYYSSFLHFAGTDNVIHANMRQGGTTTGRFSYSNPNLQNVPKEDEEEDVKKPFIVRSCFVPRPGYSLVAIDYSQMEYRMMLDYAGEHRLIEDVMNGVDVHDATAQLLGVPRKMAKTVNFACIAEGQLVLTDRGLIPIEQVLLTDLVWDGEEFVEHEGVIYNGEKEVITHQGLTATADHVVFTRCGREVSLGEVASQQGKFRIATTEIAGVPYRYTPVREDHVGQVKEAPYNQCDLPGMSKNLFRGVREYFARPDKNVSMSAQRAFYWIPLGGYSQSFQAVLGGPYSMQLPPQQVMAQLWGSWDTCKDLVRRICGFLSSQLFRGRNFKLGCGSYRQQWPLRKGEPSPGEQERESAQQKKMRVYDILNCGPRHRFTVSGKLVHNCLYGAGVDKLSKMLKLSPQAASRLRQHYFAKLPRVRHFMQDVPRRGAARGYIFNWAGRRCHIANKNFAYKLPNHLIQGGCADVVKKAMLGVSECLRGHDAHMILQVHDELLFEMSPESFHLIPQIREIMESVYPGKNGITLQVDVDHSWKSWGYRDMEEGIPGERKCV